MLQVLVKFFHQTLVDSVHSKVTGLLALAYVKHSG